MLVVCSNVHYLFIPAGVGIEVETFKGQISTGIFVTPPKLNSSPLEP